MRAAVNQVGYTVENLTAAGWRPLPLVRFDEREQAVNYASLMRNLWGGEFRAYPALEALCAEQKEKPAYEAGQSKTTKEGEFMAMIHETAPATKAKRKHWQEVGRALAGVEVKS